jgi:uncharacterized membrane protein YagU involved in acid resistance
VAHNTHRTSKGLFALYIGFFAGLIWGGVRLLSYGLKFTTVPPGFLIKPFFKNSFVATWPGMLLGWGSFIVFSLVAALIFIAFLRKVRGSWVGLVYGFLWWVLIYVVIGPIFGMVDSLLRLDLNSLAFDFCLFILWGLFIGYSIVFEYTNEQRREPKGMQEA